MHSANIRTIPLLLASSSLLMPLKCLNVYTRTKIKTDGVVLLHFPPNDEREHRVISWFFAFTIRQGAFYMHLGGFVNVFHDLSKRMRIYTIFRVVHLVAYHYHYHCAKFWVLCWWVEWSRSAVKFLVTIWVQIDIAPEWQLQTANCLKERVRRRAVKTIFKTVIDMIEWNRSHLQ